MPAATIFSVEDLSVHKVCCSVFVCLCCVNSRWSTWVVRVGMSQRSLSPIPRSQGWACGSSADMCIFFYVVFAFIVLLFIVYFSTYFCFPIFLSY